MAEGCGTTKLLQLATATQVGEARAALPVQTTALQHCEEQIILECRILFFSVPSFTCGLLFNRCLQLVAESFVPSKRVVNDHG
jgi:hypothetical protein